MKIENKPMYDIMKVPQCHKEGDDQRVLRAQLHFKLYAYACAVYALVAPECMIHMEQSTSQICLSNFHEAIQRRSYAVYESRL